MPLPIYPSSKEKTVEKPIKHVIAIAAGKGGVGKSTVTVHLARVLAKMGHRVGVLDADVYGPSVRKMLPEDTMPRQDGELLIPGISKGIKVISMAYFRKDNEAAAVRAPIANGIINQFLKVQWGDLDYLLIDFPPGTGDVQLTLCQQAKIDGALLVTTPQEVALLDVRKALHLFEQVQVPLLGIAENMSYFLYGAEKNYVFGKGGGKRFAAETGLPLLGEIPLDPLLSHAGDKGEEVERGPSAEAFQQLAQAVAQQLEGKIPSLAIKKVWQPNPQHLSLEWSDGLFNQYRLSDLQKMCPCANCVDENTGERKALKIPIQEDVTAFSVSNVGRYAIRIQYSSGCSTGLYSYQFLRNFAPHAAL